MALSLASASLADKLAFLQSRARDGTARAIELAALARFAITRGDLGQAWAWTCRAFSDDALNPHVEDCLLALAAHMPLDKTAPYLDLMLKYDRRSEVLARLLNLRFGGLTDPIVARVQATATGAEVWIACRSDQPFALRAKTDASEMSVCIVPKAGTSLARAFGHAASICVPWVGGMTFVEFDAPDVPMQWIRQHAQRPVLRPTQGTPHQADGRTSVLVPVHGDPTSLRSCLDSLFGDEEPASERRLVLIDDASHDDVIGALLTQAAEGGAEILVNERNLGFTASINRGLCHVGAGDVVLLNSDTVVPPRWLTRLRAVASAHPSVGSVTPLSNNGESVSAPQAFRNNPMPSPETIRRLAAELWARNGTQAIDIPAGIGFCLYLTQAAREAGGLLDEVNYGRGYLEEVDFCLRIKAAGLRNVCAAGVYIGHEGEASFGLEKAYLVAMNTRTLQALHPDHEANYQRFAMSDPLRDIRAMCQ